MQAEENVVISELLLIISELRSERKANCPNPARLQLCQPVYPPAFGAGCSHFPRFWPVRSPIWFFCFQDATSPILICGGICVTPNICSPQAIFQPLIPIPIPRRERQSLPFEWLAELAYYLAFKWAGLPGVFLLVFLLCAAIVLGIFCLSYLASHDVTNSFLATVAAAILMAISIGARTLLFGWLYLVILLLILEAARRDDWKWLWLVPPLFCVWVNSHGSWPMGMAVFGIFIASGVLQGGWGHAYATRWSGPQLRRLLITAGASAVALFVNPFGYRLVSYPFQAMFGAQSGLNNIQEFASIDFHTPWGKVAIVLILGVLLIVGSFAGALAVGRTWVHHAGPLLFSDQYPLHVPGGNSCAPHLRQAV